MTIVNKDTCDFFSIQNTPYYLVDLPSVEANYTEFKDTWKKYFPKVSIAYSVKTNPLSNILQLLAKLGAYADVTSQLELDWSISDGFAGNNIFLNGSWKNEELLRKAIKLQSHIQVDSLQELHRLLILSNGIPVSVGLRINVNQITRSWGNRFGIGTQQFNEAITILQQFNLLGTPGIHIHLGEMINNREILQKGISLASALALKIKAKFGCITRFNIGGGYFSKSTKKKNCNFSILTIQEIAVETQRICAQMLGSIDNIELCLEPGRFIVETSAYLISSIRLVKEVDKEKYAIVDTDIRCCRSMSAYLHPMHYFSIGKKSEDSLPWIGDIYGCQCNPENLFYKNLELTHPPSNRDRFVIYNVGAYDMVGAHNWSTPIPPIYINDGCNVRLVSTQDECKWIRGKC